MTDDQQDLVALTRNFHWLIEETTRLRRENESREANDKVVLRMIADRDSRLDLDELRRWQEMRGAWTGGTDADWHLMFDLLPQAVAELVAARATIARVEALADDWSCRPYDMVGQAVMVRKALAGEQHG